MKKLLITINDIDLEANLLDTPTAEAIYKVLPFEGYVQKWGDEIYFGIPVNMHEETTAKVEVEVGDLAFWPVGSAFCIFFGKTPVSSDNRPRAYSPVNIFGKIEGNFDALKKVKSQSLIQVKRLL